MNFKKSFPSTILSTKFSAAVAPFTQLIAIYSIRLITHTRQHVECLRSCGVSTSLCGKQRKRWAAYAHLNRAWRHSRKYHCSLRQEIYNGSEVTQREMTQGQRVQLLFDGSATCDQKAINYKRPTTITIFRICRHARAVIAQCALRSCGFHRCMALSQR